MKPKVTIRRADCHDGWVYVVAGHAFARVDMIPQFTLCWWYLVEEASGLQWLGGCWGIKHF